MNPQWSSQDVITINRVECMVGLIEPISLPVAKDKRRRSPLLVALRSVELEIQGEVCILPPSSIPSIIPNLQVFAILTG
jgi:hypothetical protein